jgi:hypothetical protein
MGDVIDLDPDAGSGEEEPSLRPRRRRASEMATLHPTGQLGAPSARTPEMMAAICEQIASGMSLGKICAQEGYPNRATVIQWVLKYEDFRDMYRTARKVQVEGYADEIVGIADDTTNDYRTVEKRNGQKVQAVDHEHISRSKVRIDTRWRLMAAMMPHVYGDHVEVEHRGAVAHLVIKDE